jgi:hypothetical protein
MRQEYLICRGAVMNEEAPSFPRYALQLTDLWDGYEQTVPEEQVARVCSMYWSSTDTISVPPSRLRAEFVRYHLPYDDLRPSAIYSGVLWPASEKYRDPEGKVYDELVEAAWRVYNDPLLSYSRGEIQDIKELRVAGDNAGGIAVTEAGCEGYFESTLTILERQGPVLIRTSVQSHGVNTRVLPIFAHGLQAIVRSRIGTGFDEYQSKEQGQ